MCDITSELLRAGVSRRALLAGAAGMAGVGAAGVAGAPTARATAGRPGEAHGYRTQAVLLGTAGGPTYWTNTTRNGIASAVAVGDRYYLVDAGHNVVRQIREAGLGNAASDALGPLDALTAIFLTHLHSDHVVDLNNVLTVGIANGLQTHAATGPVPVWGPGNRGSLPPTFGPLPAPPVVAPVSPTPGTAEMLDLMVRAFATDYNDRARDSRLPVPDQLFAGHDVPVPAHLLGDPDGTTPRTSPFPVFEDDRVRVTATLVQHGAIFPALAYRFDTDDGSVTFSGDTAPHPNLVELATGTDVLVHEAIDRRWVEQFLPAPRTPAQQALFDHLLDSHTEVTAVGAVAEQAGARTLALTHLGPGGWPEHLWLDAQKGFSGTLVVGRDLDRIGVGRRERISHLHRADR